MATLGDVAARAGVSISAVSRVLSDSPSARVSDATRKRIVDAARDLQYHPNWAGRALKSGGTKVIGLVVPDLTNPLFTELLHGADDEVAAHGYTVLLGRADGARPYGEVMARLLGEGRVDALVVQAGDGVPPAGLGNLVISPIVLMNSVLPGQVGSVSLDDETGAFIATQHLLDLGHRRIAFANGLLNSYTANRRRMGYLSAMARAGTPVLDGYETRCGYLDADGKAALRQLMTLEVPPTAIMVGNVNAAIGMLSEARAMGVKVPADLSIACVHDSWTAENTWPPLTAVKMQFYSMGRVAVRSVIHRIETGQMTDETILDPAPELVVRESTSPVA